MNPHFPSPWLLVPVLASLLPASALFGAEANPANPIITGVTMLSNSQRRVSWTPYPAAQEFKVLTTTNLGQLFAPDLSGTISGYDWTSPMAGPADFHRVQVMPLSSNALLGATVLNRLTYGPTPDEVERMAAIGPEPYIQEQLAGEQIAEGIDTDPPITNSPPAAPPLTNWIRVSATGTATVTNFFIYLSGPGQVYLDDVRLVLGTNADVGLNLLSNGDFEEPPLSNGWTIASIYSGSSITNSPTVDGQAASGTNCLLLNGTAGGSGNGSSVQQVYSATNYPTGQRFALSFSYLPVQNSGSNVLTIRLSGSQTIASIPLPSAPASPPAAPPALAAIYAKLTNNIATLDDLRAWHVFRAVHGKRQLQEVLAQFFQNHFTTQYQKTKDYFDNNFNVGAYTNDSIRQSISVDLHWREHKRFRDLLLNPDCNFYDLLKASIESPAMVIYLDTILNTRAAPNQNYGREILELHTMGADNGYVQQDIVELAKVWTGWRVDKKDASVANDVFATPIPRTDKTNFANTPGVWVLHYSPANHESNSVKRMFTNVVIDPRFGAAFRGGQPYLLTLTNGAPAAGTNGFAEGYAVIQHLSSLPFTMEFISVKLCQLFVHENFEFGTYDYTLPNLSPEAQLVKDCMTAWDTPAADGRKGNIRSILKTIFDSALFRGHAASQQKIKTPLEFAVSAVRALRIVSTDANGWVSSTADTDGYGISGTSANTSPLSRMGGMGLFNRAEPDGYSELGRIWLNTANLCERMRFAQHLLMPATGSNLKSSDYGSPGTRNVSDPVKLLKLKLPAQDWYNAGAVVDYFLSILYPGEGKANLDLDRTAAIQFLNMNESGVNSPFDSLANNAGAYDGRVRGMVGLLMSLPRFQEQ